MDDTNSTRIKPVSELGIGFEPVPTKETWEEFKEWNLNPGQQGGYLNGHMDMLRKLEEVVTISDFGKMKEELTKLYIERYEFLSHAYNNP